MADHPDVYADGLTASASPIGVTLTFTRTEPAVPRVAESEQVVIACRIHLARPMAQAVRDLLTRVLEGKKEGTETVTH
jgi:hypothetical protein